MKTIALILFIICFSIKAQDNISIGIYQDARLGLLGDDHGNPSGTLDIKLDIALQGKQFTWYYFEVRTQLEYADLHGGKYVSWLVSGGWVFNKLLLNNIEVGSFLTIGTIHRWNTSYGTYGITGDLSYKISKHIKLSAMYQIIKRSDLVARWNEQDSMVGSFFIGLKYSIL